MSQKAGRLRKSVAFSFLDTKVFRNKRVTGVTIYHIYISSIFGFYTNRGKCSTISVSI